MANNSQLIDWDIRNQNSPLGSFMSNTDPLQVVTLQFVGKNISDQRINPIEAYVFAPKTGEKFELGAVLDGNIIPLSESCLAAGGTFSLSYKFPGSHPQDRGSVLASEFIDRYPELHFRFRSEGYEHEQDYGTAELTRYLMQIEADMRRNMNAMRGGVMRRS